MFGCCSFLMIIKWPCLLKHRKMPNPDLLYWNCKVDVLMVQLYTTHRRLNSLVSGRAQLKRPFDHRKMMKNGWWFSYLVKMLIVLRMHTTIHFHEATVVCYCMLTYHWRLGSHWRNTEWTVITELTTKRLHLCYFDLLACFFKDLRSTG